jgi:hypothetical protein
VFVQKNLLKIDDVELCKDFVKDKNGRKVEKGSNGILGR